MDNKELVERVKELKQYLDFTDYEAADIVLKMGHNNILLIGVRRDYQNDQSDLRNPKIIR